MDTQGVLNRIISNIEKIIVDKRPAIELTVMSLICKGHVLIEDVPGVGKTSLASALAKSLSCTFKRIQFTPDIMPSDIMGFSIFNPKTGDFEYRKGAVFSQVILADEINRTSPKTQSSLLEAMQERQVTVDGATYDIPAPFIVLATQNPVEYLGTYPLPEAQMDRFFMRISLGYPSPGEELNMIYRFTGQNPLAALEPVATGEEILELQRQAEQIHVAVALCDYIVSLANHTRKNGYVALGASPRASISLFKAAQAWALYQGRNYTVPDDILKMAHPVLEHRITLTQEGKLRKMTPRDVVAAALKEVRVPVL